MVLHADRVCDALVDITSACGTPPKGPECDLLIDDVSALAAIFANVMRVDYLRLRLDVVRSNACRKFHIDAVTARLVCTYRGTGTQYGVATMGATQTASSLCRLDRRSCYVGPAGRRVRYPVFSTVRLRSKEPVRRGWFSCSIPSRIPTRKQAGISCTE